ncbi:unnamed protein product [Toxocara canis]|uniref:MFS domain-containing protein n=1 Tax=Toxocara canis TaxID=6265 RepID=A0A183UVY5_TOXCA|nr:unnamed protein product [Toxocara canis]
MVSKAICVLTLALCLSSGFQQGYIATVLNQPYIFIERFINSSWITTNGHPISPNALNVLWASLNIVFPAATIVGQFCAAFLCSRIGRKRTAILATSLYVPGAALSFLARYCHPHFELLFIGRVRRQRPYGKMMNVENILEHAEGKSLVKLLSLHGSEYCL